MSLMRGAAMRRRGEPVWVLMAIVGGWIGARAATWDIMGGDLRNGRGNGVGNGRGSDLASVRAAPRPGGAAQHSPGVAGPRPGVPKVPSDRLVPDASVHPLVASVAGRGMTGRPLAVDQDRAPGREQGDALTVADIDAEAPVGSGAPRAAGWLEPSAAPARLHPSMRRWSGDAWMVWRRDGNSATGGGSVLLPSYGANQVGGALRYRLAPASGFRPTAYVRAYGALNSTGEREVAAGLSARPVPAVPVIVMGEARASHFAGGTTHIRPAVTVVSELPPVMLPGAMRAETYVQGGYVGGAASTAFVDGQFRLEHIAARSAHAEVRLGGGVWGGAQTGAGRMDVGPTATVAFQAAGAGAHVSVDWRFRVAGNALPGSGPAVTLAAGF